MEMGSDTQLIVVGSEKCINRCGYCYYRYRQQQDKNTISSEIVKEVMGQFHHIAVGINPGYSKTDIEIADTALVMGKELTLTISPDRSTGDASIPPDIIRGASVITLSNCIRPSSKLIDRLNDTTAIRYLSIVDTVDLCDIDEYLSYMSGVMDDIYGLYVLHRRLDTSTYTTTDGDIERYVDFVVKMDGNTYDIPVVMDECICSIVSGTKHKCGGVWIEINMRGEVRNCPYSSIPDTVIKDSNQMTIIADTVPKCRRMEWVQ